MLRLSMIAAISLTLAIVLAAAASPQQSGDASNKARKLTNVTWFEVRQVDFKPGKRDEALKIIRESFQPAAESAGLAPARLIEYATGGRWDIQMIFTMTDGPSELEWEIHPDSEKWMTALAAQCGGEDKAQALTQAYRDLIASVDNQIAYERKTGQ